jgi:hypothetical protein
MKWLKIDPDNLPIGEVLAACFSGSYGDKEKIIGSLGRGSKKGTFTCMSEYEALHECTHYIDIHKHDDERE